MKFLNNKAEDETINLIKAKYNKIDIKAGSCRYNYKCQMNAVHDAIENKQDKIAMCLCIEDKIAYIHFVNVNKKGDFIDNTYGHWSTQTTYYFVRYVNKDSFFNVNGIFTAFSKELRKKLSWRTRMFSDVEF